MLMAVRGGRRNEDSGVGPPLASIGQRFVAFTLDCLLFAPLLVLDLLVRPPHQDPVTGATVLGPRSWILVVLFPVLSLVYEIAFIRWRGQTLGKMAVGIVVVDAKTGSLPGWRHAVVRAVAPFIAARILVGTFEGAIGAVATTAAFLDDLWALFDRRRQTLHDKVAGTVVVRVEHQRFSAGTPRAVPRQVPA